MEQDNLSILETFYKYIEDILVYSGIHGLVTAILDFITESWQRGGHIAGSACDFCAPFGARRPISPTVENQEDLTVQKIKSDNFSFVKSLVAMLVRRSMTKEIDGVSFVLGFLAAVCLGIAYLLVRMVLLRIRDKIRSKAKEFIDSCIRSHRTNVLMQYAEEKRDQHDL